MRSVGSGGASGGSVVGGGVGKEGPKSPSTARYVLAYFYVHVVVCFSNDEACMQPELQNIRHLVVIIYPHGTVLSVNLANTFKRNPVRNYTCVFCTTLSLPIQQTRGAGGVRGLRGPPLEGSAGRGPGRGQHRGC